ncbi:MAG: hypothetical protein UW24_C0017G0005 [Parcubacteria group bacterium GW2011_GWA2_44_12]|nr:MAG: hypothetical protein UW24_C0017G0005 [Parcubacteria group bacterium GW2011_GWA2_44_12]
MDQNLSDSELHVGYFVFLHKQKFIKFCLGLFVVANAVLVIFMLIQMALFFRAQSFEGQNKHNFSTRSIAWYDPTLAAKTTAPHIEGIYFVKGAPGVYKLIAKIVNQNPDWVVWSFSYRFVVDGVETPYQKSFLLPGDNFVTGRAESKTPIRGMKLEMNHLIWKQMNQQEREKIALVKFQTSTLETRFTESTGFENVSFTISNNSAYSFYAVPFLVIARRGADIIEFGYITAAEFQSKESRAFSLQLGKNSLTNTSLAIVPRVNLLDDNAFMPVSVWRAETKTQ